MDLRHIFSFFFFFFLFSFNQKLGRTQGKKKKRTKTNPKDLLYMIKLSRNVLFLEKKLVICWAFETIIQLPVFTKETVKSSIKETPQVYFLGWKTELEYLGTRYQKSTEHNFPLNAGGNPNIHNQKQRNEEYRYCLATLTGRKKSRWHHFCISLWP